MKATAEIRMSRDREKGMKLQGRKSAEEIEELREKLSEGET